MSVLCVASDEDGVGKTAFCASLAHILAEQGKKVSVFKPFKDKGAGRSSDPDRVVYERLTTVVEGEWPGTLGRSGVDRALLDELASRLVGPAFQRLDGLGVFSRSPRDPAFDSWSSSLEPELRAVAGAWRFN